MDGSRKRRIVYFRVRWSVKATRSRLILCALVAGVIVSTAGCGQTRTATPPTRVSLQAMTHPLIIPTASGKPDALYVPDPIEVRVGQAIVWTNKDGDPHDVTAYDGTFASGPIATDGSFRWIPTQPGTYHYFCTLHPEMHGVIIVRS